MVLRKYLFCLPFLILQYKNTHITLLINQRIIHQILSLIHMRNLSMWYADLGGMQNMNKQIMWINQNTIDTENSGIWRIDLYYFERREIHF
jgi:hypothetical protein